MRKNNCLITILLMIGCSVHSQTIHLEDILKSVEENHPQLKMYDAEIRSMDTAAAGAKSWMPPEFSTGFWMMPYNPSFWKKQDMGTGMGQYMIGMQQMLPNRKRQQAESAYMKSMSAVQKENRNASLNELKANARSAYANWVIQVKRVDVLKQNEKLLDFMIRNAEIRYKNNMGKLNAYYKAKAALGDLKLMQEMAASEIEMQRIRLSTLVNLPIPQHSVPDTNFQIQPVTTSIDTSTLVEARSDIKAIEQQKQINILQQQVESSKLKPEFGLKYDHMFGFGGLPQQFNLMAMIRIPMASWSSKMNKANIQSLEYKNEALEQQRKMIVNELTGMALELQQEITAKNRQLELYQTSIIPALRNNYQSMLLAYEQNTEELFMLYDAWESLNMMQLKFIEEQGTLYQLNIQQQRLLEKR
jgi:outer membrane protein TolC